MILLDQLPQDKMQYPSTYKHIVKINMQTYQEPKINEKKFKIKIDCNNLPNSDQTVSNEHIQYDLIAAKTIINAACVLDSSEQTIVNGHSNKRNRN